MALVEKYREFYRGLLRDRRINLNPLFRGRRVRASYFPEYRIPLSAEATAESVVAYALEIDCERTVTDAGIDAIYVRVNGLAVLFIVAYGAERDTTPSECDRLDRAAEHPPVKGLSHLPVTIHRGWWKRPVGAPSPSQAVA